MAGYERMDDRHGWMIDVGGVSGWMGDVGGVNGWMVARRWLCECVDDNQTRVV